MSIWISYSLLFEPFMLWRLPSQPVSRQLILCMSVYFCVCEVVSSCNILLPECSVCVTENGALITLRIIGLNYTWPSARSPPSVLCNRSLSLCHHSTLLLYCRQSQFQTHLNTYSSLKVSIESPLSWCISTASRLSFAAFTCRIRKEGFRTDKLPAVTNLSIFNKYIYFF